MYQGTHITLPDRLMLNPVAGDGALWTVEGNGHHIMVQPNSAEPEGRESTLTLIDQSNTSYHFKLRRVSNNPDTCVTVKKAEKFFKKAQGQGGRNYQTPKEREQAALKIKIEQLQQALKEEKQQSEKRIDDILKKYRSFIYTRYKWTEGMGFKGSKLVTDVYDDGRFTFIRVVPDQRGVLAVSAKIDGKQEMIQYNLDSDSIYKISGIYPEFNLQYGKSKVKITRKDNKSNGAY
jgi:type IV secretory pathway VirB9-like protein